MRRRSSKPGDPRLVVGLVRVSTSEQAASGLGLEAQRAALAAWCTARGARLVAVHEERGTSGSAPLDKRPGLLAAVQAVRDTGAGVLLAAKRCRVGRDMLAVAAIEHMVARIGARVETADGVGEGTDPAAALVRRILDCVSTWEVETIRARTKAALGAKRARGELAGSVPYGQRLAADGTHLEADPAEQAVVAAVRRLRAEGLTLRAIAARLEAEGHMARGGRPWHASTLARIARSAVEAA